MKIVSLHIYHFGALKDCRLSLERTGFQLLFGENEAGKTTLMDFIKCVLFGFPVKNQAQRRYEPKNGNRLGGKLTVDHPKLGIWTIERIAGTKAAGDVTIYDETGQHKDESFIMHLLDGMDVSLFTGAYCFGLDGLQKLDKLTSEELGNFLLSTALSGDRDLLEIEQTFERKQSLLFKKAGKKPVINEKLEQLKAAGQSLQSFREKNESYQMLDNQKEIIEKKIHQTQEELDFIQRELRSLKRLFELRPVLEKYKQLQHELKSFDPEKMTFPENGIQRYEQWQKEGSLLNSELQYIEDRLLKMEKERKLLETDKQLLSYKRDIKQLFNKLPHFEHLLVQLKELTNHAEELQNQESSLFEAIGEIWPEEELMQLNVSLSALHEHEEMLKKRTALLEKKRRLETELEESRVKLERLEKEEAEQKQRLLPEEEHARYEQERSKTYQHQKNLPYYAMMLPVISAIVLIWSGWTSDKNSVVFAGVLILLAAGVMILTSYKKDGSTQDTPVSSNHRLLEDEVNRKQWIQLTAALQHENTVYLQVAKQLDYLEIEEASVYEQAEKWARSNGYKGDNEKLLMSGYMNSLYKIKEIIKQKVNTNQKRHNITSELSHFKEAAERLASFFHIEITEDVPKLIEELHARLENQVRKETEREHFRKNCNELSERKKTLLKQIQHINNQVVKLLNEAGADTAEQYYENGKRTASYIKHSEERDRLYNQLLSLGYSSTEMDSMAEKVTEKYEDSVQLLEGLERKEKEQQTELSTATEDRAKLKWELKQLLEDGSYSEHMHRYELLKEEWNQLVKKWAGLKLAQHALQKVKEDYQQTKLPAVLETSSGYFSKITEGEYQSILFTDANELLVLKGDGTRFYPHELSRGTAEQVYLAIRLAVAANAGPAGFPVLMDDIAVNFDQKRTRRTLSLIQEFARDRQVLFFTCHSHIESIVPDVPFIHWPDRSVLAEK
jgi:uncharacterized protein YhaN